MIMTLSLRLHHQNVDVFFGSTVKTYMVVCATTAFSVVLVNTQEGKPFLFLIAPM